MCCRRPRTDVASAAQSVDDITCGTGDAQAHTAAITDPLYLSSCRVFFSGIDQVAASGCEGALVVEPHVRAPCALIPHAPQRSVRAS